MAYRSTKLDRSLILFVDIAPQFPKRSSGVELKFVLQASTTMTIIKYICLSESCLQNGDLPKSPLIIIGSSVPSVGANLDTDFMFLSRVLLHPCLVT